MEIARILYLGIILVICAVTDIREKKIRNRWIMAGLAGAVICYICQWNGQALLDGICMLLIIFAVLFPLYLVRAIGAGDVKLLCMTGLYVERTEAEVFCIALLIAAGVMSLIKLVYYASLRKRMVYFFQYVRKVILTGDVEEYGIPNNHTEIIGIAVPVLVAFLGWRIWLYVM